MEPIQYNPTQSNNSFNPVSPVDSTGPLATEHEKLLAAEREVLAGMRRDAATIAANDREKIKGMEALAEFSTRAAEELGQLYVDDAVRQRKDAFVQELLNPTAPSPDYVEGRKEAESQYIDGQKVATEVGKVDYEAAEPFRSGSVWAQMGRKEAQALMGIENELPRIIQEATKQFSAVPPAEREELINDVVANYAESRGLTGLRRSFLEDKILPAMRGVKDADSRKYKLSWTQRDGARREEDIRRGLSGANPASIIPSLAALPDQYGYPIGNAGAWDKFEQMISEARINQTLSDEDYEKMRSAVIPEGNPGAGKTYGEYYRGRFYNIDKAIMKGEFDDFKDGENRDKIEARELEEQMVAALQNDKEGYSSETVDEMQAQYTALTGGKTSARLENLRSGAVDVVADEAVTDRLKAHKRDGSLSVRLLKSLGVSGDVYDEFYEDAVRLDKAKAAASSPDFIEELVKLGGQYGRQSVQATPDGSRNFTVGEASDELTRYYNRTLSSILEADPDKSESQAQKEAKKATIEEYRENDKYEVTPSGYEAFDPLKNGADTSGVAAARQRRKQIEENAERVPGYLDKGIDEIGNQAAFSKGELENITSTYGSVDFVMPEKAKALARIKGIDPFQVINRQLRANGMEPLPESPAIQVFQDSITPEQQRIFNMNPTPASSIRTLGSTGEFKPELIPKGYGSLIEQAAKQYDIPPSVIAGLIETESNWNPQAVSPAGAKGLTQFMPATAAEWGVNPFDPASAIDGAGKYLRYLVDYFGGDLEKAIYAYNGGMGNVERLGVGFDGPGGENYNYYPKVMRAAYKYGYKEALNVALVRPAFQ